jgi:hypothetical protein
MTTRTARYSGPASPVSLAEARKLVPVGPRRMLMKYDGETPDIVKSVLAVYNRFNRQAAPVAGRLRGANALATIQNVFAFVGGQIDYRLDPPRVQWIKTPGAIIREGFADCKGLSILTASLLAALGIPAAFRFAAYAPGAFTHVYVLAYPYGSTTPLVVDTCLPRLGEEKAPDHKQDFLMSTSIQVIAGLGADTRAEYGDIAGLNDGTSLGLHGHETDAEFDLKLARESRMLDRRAVASVAGIGQAAHYDSDIAALNDGIAAASLGDWDKVEGIGSAIGRKKGKKKLGKFLKKVANKAKKAAKGGLKVAKKVGKGYLKVAKKVGKFALKAVTAPQRLLVKGIAEVILPKVAPFFIYLFIKNPATLAALPAKVARKRKKAERFAKFMTNVIGMKESHFMKIISNGIKRKYKASPEVVLARTVKGPISGIAGCEVDGLYGIGEPVTIILMIVSLIGKLSKLFGKHPSAEETPTTGIRAKRKLRAWCKPRCRRNRTNTGTNPPTKPKRRNR